MPLSRTTKMIAQRIDHRYFKKPHALRTGRKIFTILLTLGALGAVLGLTLTRNERVYNPGPVSRAHAMFEQNCAACHESDSNGGFFKTVSDAGCSKCHLGAIHHPNESKGDIVTVSLTNAPEGHPKSAQAAGHCATCHVEHQGKAALAGISNEHCLQCHGNLKAHVNEDRKENADRFITEYAVLTSKKFPGYVENFEISDQGKKSHPPFGRRLRDPVDPRAPMSDPTKLRFNHSKHMRMPNVANDCSLCHGAEPMQAAAQPLPQPLGKQGKPPWLSEKDAPFAGVPIKATTRPTWPASAANSADRRYMQPVNFERHCYGCHALQLQVNAPAIGDATPTIPANTDLFLPHRDVETLRPWLEKAVRDAVNAPDAKFKVARVTGAEDAFSAFKGMLAMARPGAADDSGDKPDKPDDAPAKPADDAGKKPDAAGKGDGVRAAWARAVIDGMVKEINDAADALAADANTPASKQRLRLAVTEKGVSDAGVPADVEAVVEYYVAYTAIKNCALCHDLEGNGPVFAAPKPAAGASARGRRPSRFPEFDGMLALARPGAAPDPDEDKPAEKPADKPAKPGEEKAPASALALVRGTLKTVPTRIPAEPRRWFLGSHFNHNPHRNVSCVECHGKAPSSSETSDVLMPAMETCVQCHKTDQGGQRFAGADCAMCHDFHDRTREAAPATDVRSIKKLVDMTRSFPPEPSGSAPSTQPAKPAGKPAAPVAVGKG